MLSISRVSKRFNVLTAPSIYEQVAHKGFFRAGRFLRTILSSREELALYVKEYRFKLQAHAHDEQDKKEVLELLHQEIVKVRHIVQAVSPTPKFASKWMKALYRGEWSALVALILCHFTNLEWLCLLPERDVSDGTSKFIRHAVNFNRVSSQRPLPNSKLQEMSIGRDVKGATSFTDVVPWLSIATLEVLQLQDITQDKWITPKKISSTVKRLILTEFRLDEARLWDILRFFPKLKDLELCGIIHFESETHHGDAFIGGLSHLKESLENLKISVPWEPTYEGAKIDMSDFQRLEVLEIPLPWLVVISPFVMASQTTPDLYWFIRLPRSIKNLSLNAAHISSRHGLEMRKQRDDEISLLMKQIIPNKVDCLPELCELAFDKRFEGELCSELESVGVELMWLSPYDRRSVIFEQ